ncbi:MAG: N-acetyl-gamma-glutamyl-phosphate reductase [Deltaproteobacteria bacterium]|nr:N-acetyl-gamma-glutamyl-phosphate reductase [Deltaproteobacteria bacterium]
MPEPPIPAVVLGGTGYVAGELLRLLLPHPRFSVACVASTTRQGEPVTAAFPHLAGTALDDRRFAPVEAAAALLGPGNPAAIFAATPHGATAALLDRLLAQAEAAGADAHAVDLSADFRFRDPVRFGRIYGTAHAAPGRCAAFRCSVPEHDRGETPVHAAQPGCFVTAVVCAAYPALALGLVEPDVFVSAVTGSSGSGRTPAANTHHPERRSNLCAYSPLSHRHEEEMRILLGEACGGVEPNVDFVPHSGPFVRGIHATLRMTLREPRGAADVADAYRGFYGERSFVEVSETPPRLAEVVGTNRCRLGLATRGRTLVVASVLDNLVKGAAGGAIQWMNRLFGLPEDSGLRLPGLGYF